MTIRDSERAELLATNWAMAVQALAGDLDDPGALPTVRMALQTWGGFLGKIAAESLSGNVPTNDTALAWQFLATNAIEIRAEGNLTIVINYRKDPDGRVMTGEIGYLEQTGRGWNVNVTTLPYFWGPDWRNQPQVVSCDLDGVVEILLRALCTRMDSEGVVEVWR